jgi:DNA mismatch repair protein MutL
VKIPVTPEEKFLVAENIGIMESMGFEIASSENIFCEISAVPQILGEVNVREVFQDILASLEAGEVSPELRKDRIAKSACKRAVKAGNKMSDTDVRELIHTIITSGSIPNCPHGRPIAISITKKQLEIGFKRRL